MAGVYLEEGSASRVLYELLLQLYHRGHEGAGMVSCDKSYGIRDEVNGVKNPYKDVGRVRDVFKGGEIAEKLGGNAAVGHTRYGTVGLDKPERYLHPIESPKKKFYVAHNGTITPFELNNLLKDFQVEDVFDTEVLVALLERELTRTGDWATALERASRYLDGSYTCTILTRDGKLIGIREPRGLKPLNYGEINRGYVMASETCALKAIGAKNITPVQPGEAVIIDGDGLKKIRFADPSLSRCSFEYIYFSDVTSEFDGISCWNVRIGAGRQLARKYLVDADYVTAIPDAGRTAALGFSWESGIPYAEVLRINREMGRVFILPEEQRESVLRRKYLPIEAAISGKKVVVVDDSIVRGETIERVVRMLRDAGAKEVHVRIAYHPISYECVHGGIAFARRDKLAINRFGSVEGVRKYIEATSLAYLSQEDLEKVGIRNACFACGNGCYPFKEAERQLALAKRLLYIG